MRKLYAAAVTTTFTHIQVLIFGLTLQSDIYIKPILNPLIAMAIVLRQHPNF